MTEHVCDMTDDYPDVPYGSDEYSGTVERRERIVRCRDCKHCDITDFSGLIINGKVMDGPVIYACHGPIQDDGGGGSVEPDDFCSRGEERDA